MRIESNRIELGVWTISVGIFTVVRTVGRTNDREIAANAAWNSVVRTVLERQIEGFVVWGFRY